MKRMRGLADRNAAWKRRWHQAVIVDYAKFLARPEVARVGIGLKERRGRLTGRISVKIYVREKVADLPRARRLPTTTWLLVPEGRALYRRRRVPTDIVWHSPLKLVRIAEEFLNPLKGGALIAVPGGDAGTFAGMVTAFGGRYALTAGHVISTLPGDIAGGLLVDQPPSIPSNMPPGASLLLGHTKGGYFGNGPSGFIDYVAIDMDAQRAGASECIDGLMPGPLLSPSFVRTNRISVSKYGGITERTTAAFSAAIPSIDVEGVTALDVDEFIGTQGPSVAEPGDSGALVVSASPGSEGGVVGLLFATAGASPDAPFGRAFTFPFARMPGVTLTT